MKCLCIVNSYRVCVWPNFGEPVAQMQASDFMAVFTNWAFALFRFRKRKENETKIKFAHDFLKFALKNGYKSAYMAKILRINGKKAFHIVKEVIWLSQ